MNKILTRVAIGLIISMFSLTTVVALGDKPQPKEGEAHPQSKDHNKGHDDHDDGHDDHDDHDKHDDHKENGDHDDHEEGKIHLDGKTIREFGIKLDVAKGGEIRQTRLFPGEVMVHLDYSANVTPRFPGVVKEIHYHIGDLVKEGAVLAVIESNDSLTPFKITAPISGRIIEKFITQGESIGENETAFKLVNLEKVWVAFSIFEETIDKVSSGQKATVQTQDKQRSVVTTVDYVSPIIDPHTRTQKGRMVLSNPEGFWKPGMFVDVEIESDPVKGAVVIPKSAIQRLKGREVVFVKKGDVFEASPVQLGASDHDFVIINSGLTVSTSYVSNGAFILKAELEKDAIGDGHAH